MFSGAVKIADLNDLDNAAQPCVVPIVNKTTLLDERPSLIRTRRPRQRAEGESSAVVSLYDCLACNGCVTESEIKFAQEQTAELVLQQIRASLFPVVSVSPQSIEAISTHCRQSQFECYKSLSLRLKRFLGVRLVLGTHPVDALLLSQVLIEFLEKARRKEPLLVSHCPGFVHYVEKLRPHVLTFFSKMKSAQQLMGFLIKTLTVDCYNAKLFVRKHDWRAPGPLKEIHRSSEDWLDARSIYHVSVMPCYDKKLETQRHENTIWLRGSRVVLADPEISQESISEFKTFSSFLHDQKSTSAIKLVDASLTTAELLQLLELAQPKNLQINFASTAFVEDDLFLGLANHSLSPDFQNEEDDQGPLEVALFPSLFKPLYQVFQLPFPPPSPLNPQCQNSRFALCNDSSHGFLDFSFREVSRILMQSHLHQNQSLPLKELGNSNLKVASLAGTPELTFALVYGFRNIQNLCRPSGARKFDFAEVMACPKGCRGGGGQPKKTVEDRIPESLPFSKVIEHPPVHCIYRYLQALWKTAGKHQEDNFFMCEIFTRQYTAKATSQTNSSW